MINFGKLIGKPAIPKLYLIKKASERQEEQIIKIMHQIRID